MKVSKYNIYTKLKKQNNKYLIIQGIKGSFDIVDDTIATILMEAEKNELLLDKIPVETIAVLKERGYLVESSEDFAFVERVCKAMNKASRQGINITILPTYNCNFRCEYCFERNLQNKGNKLLSYKMEEKTVDVIFEQIKAYVDEGLHIDCIYLFGGEPLLRTNRDIVEYICEKAKKYEIPILCVSNGYDLDKYIDLINYYSFRGVQITIDGIKEHHDSRRFLTGGQGTYNKIIENVEKAIDKLQLKIMDKLTQEYVGEVVLMNLDAERPEIGIQLLEKYHGQGIGTRVMNLFLNHLKAIMKIEFLTVRIRSDNYISQKLFGKMGAIKTGEEGKEYTKLMYELMNTMGKEKFEKSIEASFESTQTYTICYKLPVM